MIVAWPCYTLPSTSWSFYYNSLVEQHTVRSQGFLEYYSLPVFVWFKCWGQSFLRLWTGQSRLWDTCLSTVNQVPLYEGCEVSLITFSHLLRCPEHFVFFPLQQMSASLCVNWTSTNNQLMNCSFGTRVTMTPAPLLFLSGETRLFTSHFKTAVLRRCYCVYSTALCWWLEMKYQILISALMKY